VLLPFDKLLLGTGIVVLQIKGERRTVDDKGREPADGVLTTHLTASTTHVQQCHVFVASSANF